MSPMQTMEKTNAIALLKKDHETVKALFKKFENSEDKREKKRLVEEAIKELKVHATVEEQLFYPALRNEIEGGAAGLMNEADEEHHVAKVLIAELELMTGKEKYFDAKFTVLAENIRHHIKEEEGEMFPAAKKTDIDFNALGAQMLELKEKLMEEGVPEDAEMAMVKKMGLRGDSPAAAAQKSFQAPKKED